MMPVSMIANNSAKNTGATSANSTAADPPRLRRNRRKMLLVETVEIAGDSISENPGRQKKPPLVLGEIHCRKLAPDQNKLSVRIDRSLTSVRAVSHRRSLACIAGCRNRHHGPRRETR